MLLTGPDRTVQTIKNGHRHGQNRISCVLVSIENGVKICLILTQINPDKPDEAYGLTDLADGKPVMGTINLTQLEAVARAMGRVMTSDPYFELPNHIDVFHATAVEAFEIKTNDVDLV